VGLVQAPVARSPRPPSRSCLRGRGRWSSWASGWDGRAGRPRAPR
jgi:hypothetical protein